MSMSVSTFDQTLQATGIKKETWLMIISAASLLIALASLVLVARTRAELRHGITTHALVVIAPDGRIRMGELPGHVVGLRIYSTAGKTRIGLAAAPKKTAGLSVYDANGRQRVHVMFFDKTGRSEVKIVR
jgi:hypothetical protein